MGFNSVLYVLNDHLHRIKEDKDLGIKIDRAIAEASFYNKETDRSIVVNGMEVAGVQHADRMQVFAVGGNCAINLGTTGLWTDKEKILRALADDMGFVLHRKRGRK